MQALDNEFFEEYKRLDKLCGDMLGCRNGVSEYISQMETTYQGKYKVSSWDRDYKMLKHLRGVRNQIAHDSGDCRICEQSDLTQVKEFYERIFSGQDPFSLLRKANEADAAQGKKQYKQPTKEQYRQPTGKVRFRAKGFIAAGVVTILLVALLHFISR